jgi:type II secretory ATPase GspE/PulE/Tfp pilus assembly ATPase PilB-like protein
MLRPGDAIKQMILDRRPADEIDKFVSTSGMLTLEQSGKIAAVTGQTTMEELVDTLPMM